ncbi:MAG TPA: hypothetical protein VGG74_00470 [Kofleriaceae bacterium]
MVVELEKHERCVVRCREGGHAIPERAKQLASAIDRGKRCDDVLREPLLLLAIERVDERFLRLEVAIDRSGADLRTLGDFGNRDAVEAALDKQVERRLHDRLAFVAGDDALLTRTPGGDILGILGILGTPTIRTASSMVRIAGGTRGALGIATSATRGIGMRGMRGTLGMLGMRNVLAARSDAAGTDLGSAAMRSRAHAE